MSVSSEAVQLRPSRRTVMIVDDSPRDAEAARSALGDRYQVEIVHDAAEALEHLLSGALPDVLVLDWILPGISGVELCRFLRSRGDFERLAILLLTVHRGTEQVVEGLAAGADDFVSKPYAPEELAARVGALVRTRELLERAERAEATIARLLEYAPDPFLSIDAQGRVSYANPQAAHAFGLPPRKLIGRPIAELLPDLVLRNISVGQGESLFQLPDVTIRGSIFAPSVRFLPGDDAARTTLALRNVTSQRQAEARRLDFYAIIAHDLRTPLSAMLIRCHLLLSGHRGELSAELVRDLQKMESSFRSLVAMINDFLDLARLEGAGYKIERRPVILRDVLRHVADDFQPLLEARQLHLRVEHPDPEAPVLGDRPRLAQVWSNLLGNAIKFTPVGGHIAARVTVGETYVEGRVSDSGPGIRSDLLPQMFKRYVRAHERRPDDGTAVASGTGLGLMIVRELVEAHGGTVGVHSVPGKGSTFWFRLPRPRRGR